MEITHQFGGGPSYPLKSLDYRNLIATPTRIPSPREIPMSLQRCHLIRGAWHSHSHLGLDFLLSLPTSLSPSGSCGNAFVFTLQALRPLSVYACECLCESEYVSVNGSVSVCVYCCACLCWVCLCFYVPLWIYMCLYLSILWVCLCVSLCVWLIQTHACTDTHRHILRYT